MRFLSPVYVATWIALSFGAVLCVALWGVYRITGLHDRQLQEAKQVDEAIHLALEMEVEFQKQLMSWGSLLLRGEDPEMRSIYTNEFIRSERKVQGCFAEILSVSHSFGLSEVDLQDLMTAHQLLSDQYKQALKDLSPTNADSLKQLDKDSFGMNRGVVEGLSLLADRLDLYAADLRTEAKRDLSATATQMVTYIIISVLTGILLSALFIVYWSRREKALIEAKTNAENTNRYKDTFLMNISHEIRTPMNAIVGLSEVLKDTSLSSDQEEYVNTIRQSGSDLLGIINEILDLSKMEAGRVEIRPASFQLRECVESAAEMIAPKAAEKGIEFSIQMDPNLPIYITADEMRVRQIMINLLGNAVKFTDQGRIDLKLEGETNEAGEYVLTIQVTDTGEGIKKRDQEKLFQAFSQVDESTARRHAGTGLGLMISRDLAQLMGGDISLNSVYGEGTTFTVTIKPDDVSKEAIRSEAFDLSVIQGKSIAIVDASEFNRMEIVKFLKRWGANVESWDSALGLIERLERGSIWDLVIIGTNLKDIPCNDLAHQLRQTCGKQVNAILKWAPYQGLRIEAKPPDFNGMVYKPIQSKPLLRKVIGVLTNREPLGPVGTSTSAEMKSRLGVLRPMKMLVVDDNRVNLRVAELILKNLGYTPDLADSGQRALEMLGDMRYDVIFMDMQMPVMDGLAASRLIREKYGSLDRPWIVALTANAMSDHKDMCIEAGMNDFLAKPVKSEAIQKIIQNVPLDISRPPFLVKKKRKLSLK